MPTAVLGFGNPVRGDDARLEREATDDPLVFLHALKWDQARRYARQILRDDYPEDVEVYLVAIENTRLDAPMSEAVETAAEEVVAALADELALAAVVHD